MKKGLDIPKLGQVITDNFPQIKFACGYGSAFFKQKGYDYTNLPLLDMIFVVEDPVEWHKENFARNRSHYGGLSYLIGEKYVTFMQDTIPSPIHYNPFVKIKNFSIKYGVINQDYFKSDLSNWDNLICAGRLQKPIQKIIENEEFDEYINKNRKAAAATALLLDNRRSLKDRDFFANVVSLSYFGDVRFSLGGENEQKMLNIVDGQYQELKNIYYPILQSSDFSDVLKLEENYMFPQYTQENNTKLVNLIPKNFGLDYVSSKKDFHSTLLLRPKEQINIIKENLSLVNSRSSTSMLTYQILTGSPLQSIKYGFQKLQKKFGGKK